MGPHDYHYIFMLQWTSFNLNNITKEYVLEMCVNKIIFMTF
jgi:hypothetical protein